MQSHTEKFRRKTKHYSWNIDWPHCLSSYGSECNIYTFCFVSIVVVFVVAVAIISFNIMLSSFNSSCFNTVLCFFFFNSFVHSKFSPHSHSYVRSAHQKANLITSIIKFCGHTLDLYLEIPFVRYASKFNILVQLSRVHLGSCQQKTSRRMKISTEIRSNKWTYICKQRKKDKSKKKAMTTSTLTKRKMKEMRVAKTFIQ